MKIPPSALVIGAGLAGAALCRSLTRRGVAVSLLDGAAAPAAGASGLPVGLLSPVTTAQPTPLSRLAAHGYAHTLAELRRLLPIGQGWQPTEIDDHKHQLAREPGALVRPGALVSVWLAEAQATGLLSTHWGAEVSRLDRSKAPKWRALDSQGAVLAEAKLLVVASAFGSLALLQHVAAWDALALPLRPVKGQMNFGPQDGPPLTARPQRRDGVYVPMFEDATAGATERRRVWAMGSTYERGVDDTSNTPQAEQRNLHSLEQISPAAAQVFRAQAAASLLQSWAGVRCASLDRLPLAGPLPDPLAVRTLASQGRRKPRLADIPRLDGAFVLCALGSRGLTLASYCAELLADTICLGKPDLPEDGRAALDPARFLWRRWHQLAK